MFGIFNRITGNGSSEKQQSFLLFPELPPELRLKIWRHALPQRVIEASVRFENDQWTCAHSAIPHHTLKRRPDPRCLPNIFSVNVEARDLCLREYVKFSQTYVHPVLDFLYVSWYWESIHTNNTATKFYPIDGQPLASFKKVAITIGRNPAFDTRFGALVDCLQKIGTPEKLLLSLVGPRLPSVQFISEGHSISSGNTVAILDWPRNPDLNMAQGVRTQVISAIEEEQQHSMLTLPDIDPKLYYIYSGP